ncbi:MAG: NUDIX domain-containing protein [Bacteroidetes bacterium]|nr:NUDIX domain-containing protein [Bacteroidota bacterium]
MHIKIYFNDKPLFLCDEMNEEINSYAHHDDAVLIDEFSTPAVNSIIHEMWQQKIHAGIFLHPELEQLKKAVWKKFDIIKAGGGLVLNEKKEILFIFRRGKWDLPKGKLDQGETIEQCAIREVQEETGLKNIALKKKLLTTYHTYEDSGRHILKETYWYEMAVNSDQTLVPQTIEDIHEVKWVGENKLSEVLGNTFPSIKDVLAKYESLRD